jgi:serine/threonine-protein kinase
MAAPDPFIGREILNGEFRILEKIGTGGMGSVYRANQTAMNRLVAVKILHPKLANRRDLVSRFRREAKAMSHLTHPNTVRVFLYGELEDGSLYIVMEYLAGRNLNQTVRAEGPMSYERALPILIQVCGALEEAHRQGIVHRDLKPENIFLCTQGGLKDFPKVLDFGLAKVTEREMRPGSVILTQEGMVFGTPEFMSPEQAQGRSLTPASDIYSLAVILYELLTGKLPFDAKSPVEYLQLHVMARPIPLGERVPGKVFPVGLAQVMSKALLKSPEDRYKSAGEFAAALKPILAATRGPSSVMPARAEPVTSAPPATRPPAGASRATRRAGLGLIVGVAAACLVMGVVLTVAVMRFLH